MKAITLWQPHASLWAHQLKINETRSWATKWTGPVAVHSAKNPPLEWFKLIQEEPFTSTLRDAGILLGLPRGAIISYCDRVICRGTKQALAELPPEKQFLETAFGDFSDGRVAWLPVNMRALKTPIYCRGYQQLWTVPEEIEQQIKSQVS